VQTERDASQAMGADDAHKGLVGADQRRFCAQGLVGIRIAVGMDCPLHESFEVRYGRLTSLLGEMEDITKDTRRSSTALLRV
jgi:hypothetical protein